jgi:acyl carrier protein
VSAIIGTEEAYELVSTLLSSHFDADPAAIVPTASLEDLGIDSLGAVELLDIVQERTLVELDTEMADLQLTVGQLADRISGAVATTAPEDSA